MVWGKSATGVLLQELLLQNKQERPETDCSAHGSRLLGHSVLLIKCWLRYLWWAVTELLHPILRHLSKDSCWSKSTAALVAGYSQLENLQGSMIRTRRACVPEIHRQRDILPCRQRYARVRRCQPELSEVPALRSPHLQASVRHDGRRRWVGACHHVARGCQQAA